MISPNKPSTDPVNGGFTTGTGMMIKVLDVRTEANNPDIPTKIQIIDPGGNTLKTGAANQTPYNHTDCPFNVFINGGGKFIQQVTINSYINPKFRSKVTSEADGRRYYFGPQDWTGCCLTEFDGIPNAIDVGQDTSEIRYTFDYRKTQIDIQVPVGLSTPTNIGSLITDQLHAPTRMTLANNKQHNTVDFAAYQQTTLKGDGTTDVIRPPLITTPTFKPFPAGNSISQPNQYMDTLCGARRQYFSVLGMDNPDKFLGLQYTRQLRYMFNNDNQKNQINSGGNGVNGAGDFGNQSVGVLGMNQAYMMQESTSRDPDDVRLQSHDKGAYILTNTYFTEENVKLIARGFRKAERYYDDLSVYIDPFSPAYKKGLAVAMDIGLYCEENSNAYPLTRNNQNNDGPGPLPAQRQRFKSGWEVENNPAGVDVHQYGFVAVDNEPNLVPPYEKCVGTIPFAAEHHRDGVALNDGQELSSFVFTSRYDGDKIYSLTDGPSSAYDKLYSKISIIPSYNPALAEFSVDGQNIYNTFVRTYTDDDPLIGLQSTETLMAMTEKYDVALIPVFPKPGDPDYFKFGGRPFIAYKSHYAVGYSAPLFDPTNPSREGQKWQIDSKNVAFGLQLGLDTSAIRNNQSLLYNTNYATLKSGDSKPTTFSSVVYMGAVNPSLDFDTTLSRFEWTGFNTPYTLGNGTPGLNQTNLQANDSPQEQVYGVNVKGAISDTLPGADGFQPLVVGGVTYTHNVVRTTNMYAQSKSERFLDSLSGLSFLDLIFYDDKGNKTLYNYKGLKTSGQLPTAWKADEIRNTLLGKLGFELSQMLPIFGSPQATFTNELTFTTDFTTNESKMSRTPCPMTTGAYISSAEFQPTGSNAQNYPLYNLYPNIGLPAQPTVSQASLTAVNLPQKLNYPYLLVYSSLMADGTDTTYYGGVDGKSKLPCIGYISRQYSGGDFFYGLEQAFSYTANKSFTITDINTEIRLPDGSRPRLQPNSGVIYKITKPIYQPPPTPPT